MPATVEPTATTPQTDATTEALAAMLADGRAKLARVRDREAAEAATRIAAETARTDAMFAPLAECVRASLPACWLPHLDLRREQFENSTRHAVEVALPGLAPIEVRFHMADYTDRDRDIGTWAMGDHQGDAAPFRVVSFESVYGDESRYVRREHPSYWHACKTPEGAMALAGESEAKRAELQAAADEQNRQRADRQRRREEAAAERKANPPPTPAERLVEALRDFIQAETPAGVE